MFEVKLKLQYYLCNLTLSYYIQMTTSGHLQIMGTFSNLPYHRLFSFLSLSLNELGLISKFFPVGIFNKAVPVVNSVEFQPEFFLSWKSYKSN